MKYKDNIEAIAKLSPDFMGFIFYEKSKRFVGDNFSIDHEVLQKFGITPVGVFVNHSTDRIIEKSSMNNFKYIQLHGDESASQCEELFKRGFKVIKAFQIDEVFDFNQISPYKSFVEYFLFDTKSEKFGGTGKKYDWTLLNKYDNEVPLFLSGGIDLGDTEKINLLKNVNIAVIDINSKFEISPGLKDVEKVSAFLKKTK